MEESASMLQEEGLLMKPYGNTFIIGWLLSFVVIIGCGVAKESNHTSAMAQLRKFGTANSLHYAERMEYAANLSVLYKAGFIYGDLYDAWDKHSHPIPLSGYVFTEIIEESNGAPINRHARSGLCAYPAEPGSSGDKIFLILLDDKFMQITSPDTPVGEGGMGGDGGFAASGGSKLLVAPYERIGGPVTRWPTEEEMTSIYEELSRH